MTIAGGWNGASSDVQNYSAGDHFGVRLGNWKSMYLIGRSTISVVDSNPLKASIIQPYIPFDNQELVKACQEVYTKYWETPLFNETGALFHFHRDALPIAFVYLHPKDLVNFSEVDKCCYLATKTDAIWENQLKKLLPNTQIMPMQVCCFSPEHQFKIIFKKIKDELKPYIAQLEENNKTLCELIGSNGKSGEIDRAWERYQQFGGESAKGRYENLVDVAYANNQYLDLYKTDGYKANSAHLHYDHLDMRKLYIGGPAYDGTIESCDPNSQQGRCLRVIHGGLMVDSFNEQDKFEATIRASEALKNSTLQNNDEVVLQSSIELDSGRSEVEDATTGFAT